ncbi:sugar phosphate isomerase/epimerase [Roseimicrobium sp. ORNL1]|uniref:sugar phosphate isomerase/epimerase family protein n=1 Tax=Roseimicrobium sp. ORNL1 TaxID=2711231 RepID=UPI0013E11540|nr:sugar phosphate isomerase/epimerase [Roseimicrobium sp. ORNL1]QIF03771.1 sugar phosphate isomerase/epimerase [Roseimicrobium sp. ORNL1]
MIKLTGIADEAGAPLDVQIKAHQDLGWDSIESRVVEFDGVKGNLHEIPEATFEKVCEELAAKNMKVSGFGSLIGNWAKKIEDDFSITEAEINRAIPRMQKLGAKLIRVMSYAVRKDADGNDLPDQMEAERIRRMAEIKKRFDDAGLTMIHENCMNWGGMSVSYVKRLNDAVPGIQWVFDTGNPVFIPDRDRPGQKQDSWEMYQAIKPHMAHVHVKDGRWNTAKNDADYTYPGEGEGQTQRIMEDLVKSGYEGYISIEPHVAVVFHGAGSADDLSPEAKAKEQYDSYVKYGRMLEAMLKGYGAKLG